ncbi:MAG: deoxyhypusine synthase family protein [Sulfolobales archaeon]
MEDVKTSREYFFRERVEVFRPDKISSLRDLLQSMAKTAYQGRKLGEIFEIIRRMLEDRDLIIYMGLAGSMATAGMWGIISWFIEKGYIDVLVSTGANVSEDIYAGLGFPYGRGSPCTDDELLLKNKIDRFYDVYADEYMYREMERLIKEFIIDLPKDHVYSSAEFMYLLGARLERLGVDSIARTSFRRKTPVFVPAIVDSGYGIAYILALKEKGSRIIIDQFKDFEQLVAISERAGDSGVIYIGGGVPKDLIQLIAVARALIEEMRSGRESVRPHKYAVQITTDLPQWGGLSGATLEEAVSWGKVRVSDSAGVNVDATIALPILAVGLKEINIQREKKDLSFVFQSVEKYVEKI